MRLSKAPTRSPYAPSPKDELMFSTIRRNRIAEGFAFNLILHSDCCDNPRYLSERAAEFADALIAELDK